MGDWVFPPSEFPALLFDICYLGPIPCRRAAWIEWSKPFKINKKLASTDGNLSPVTNFEQAV